MVVRGSDVRSSLSRELDAPKTRAISPRSGNLALHKRRSGLPAHELGPGDPSTPKKPQLYEFRVAPEL